MTIRESPCSLLLLAVRTMQAKDHSVAADFALSEGMAELHHAGSLNDDPNSADKMGASRQALCLKQS